MNEAGHPAPAAVLPPADPPTSFARHLSALVRLAAPTWGARFGLTLLLVTSTVVLGHFASADAVAAFSLGVMLNQTMQNVGLGLLLGGLVEMSAAYGRGDRRECGAVWRRSLLYGVGLGVLANFGTVLLHDFLLAIGQPETLAHDAALVTRLVVLGLPGMLAYTASMFLLESIGRPRIAFAFMVFANVVNLGLCIVLVRGWGPIPPLGSEGAAIATAIVRTALGIGAVAYVLLVLPRSFDVGRAHWADFSWEAGKRQRRIGYAEGSSMAIETSAFTMMALYAGKLGTLDLAAYSIAMNLNVVVFTLAVGIGGASAVRVAHSRGAGDPAGMARSAVGGLALHSLVVGLIAIAMFFLPGRLIGLYTADGLLAAAAIPLVAAMGLVSLADGTQRVLGNILRGYGEAWLPTTCHLLAYIFIMVPLGYVLALRMEYGSLGLLAAIGLSSTALVVLQAGRLFWLAERERPAYLASPAE